MTGGRRGKAGTATSGAEGERTQRTDDLIARQGAPLPVALFFAAMEAAFFDLDKTIVAKSSVVAFGGSFYREGLISRRVIARAMYGQLVYTLFGAGESKMERMREAMLHLTRGWDQQRIKQIVHDAIDDVIAPIVYAEALDLLSEHRDAGRRTVIISSSPAEVVEPVAEHLGVDDVICTRAAVDRRGRYTGELEFYAYGPHKAEAILDLAARDGIDLASSYAYSDSITDLPMLDVVGHPVAVNPDRDLERIARERDWPVRWFGRAVALRDLVPSPSSGQTIAASSALAAVGTGVALYVWWRRRAEPRVLVTAR